MSLSSRMIIVLTCVGLLSGAFLAGVGILTKERIAINKQKEIEEAIVKVIPGTVTSEKLHEEKDLTIYGGKNNSGKLIGFAVHASGTGFQDQITMMFGTDTSLSKISRLTILEQLETPGLGAKITDETAFLQFWENKDINVSLTLRKPAVGSAGELLPSEVNTITGATISSEAVLNTVNLSLERLRNIKNEGKLSSENPNAN